MRQILFFAVAAMVLAGVMPRVMSSVGSTPAPAVEAGQAEQQAKPPQPQPQPPIAP